MKNNKSTNDVDKYLSALPVDSRKALETLRELIKAAAPKADEVISYQIPTYKYHGPLVHFVARKDYCSFVLVSKSVIEKFKNELKDFKIFGTTVHFTSKKPLPVSLVKKIVKERVKENEASKK